MDQIKVVSPLNGDLLGAIDCDTPASLAEKIALAKTAQKDWAAIGAKARSEVMFHYRHLLKKNVGPLCELIHRENGKTMDEAKAEVEKAIELTDFSCSIPQILNDRGLMVSKGVYCQMTHQPLGVVASIVPFNFPLMVPHWTVPNALMTGNAMILKPSELVPLSAQKMLELFLEAGLPKGLLALANGRADMVEALCDHEDIRALSFVGSTKVAKIVYRRATNNLKRALCLGSAKNHLLVLPDADVDMTAQNVVASMAGMAGQRCMAASVMVTVGDCQKIIDQVVVEAKKLIPGQNLGAIISKASQERIESHIEQAQKDGAEIILDGRGAKVSGHENGNYLAPTILDHVRKEMTAAKTEIFGPVLSIIRAASVEEAIAIQNGHQLGNGASVYTSSGGLAKRVSDALTAGMVGINIGVPVPREPFSFGGCKDSKFGVGDITGESSLNFWTELKKCTSKWNQNDAINWMS